VGIDLLAVKAELLRMILPSPGADLACVLGFPEPGTAEASFGGVADSDLVVVDVVAALAVVFAIAGLTAVLGAVAGCTVGVLGDELPQPARASPNREIRKYER
jgi:hypothetical protein